MVSERPASSGGDVMVVTEMASPTPPLTGSGVVRKGLNVTERGFGVRTRDDRYALVYRGGVRLGSILLWLSDAGTSWMVTGYPR
jgi:hypothetical protein